MPGRTPRYALISTVNRRLNVSGVSQRSDKKATQMIGIEGKTVALAGASSGIGEATARTLAAAGAKVISGAQHRSLGAPRQVRSRQ
jgi:phosphoglycerate dehydrogenase-like enzyme